MSMNSALQEEKSQTTETYFTQKYGSMPALACMVDMGWQKRAAGRSYNSPSGVLHAVGGFSKKIISSFIYRNKCHICAELDHLVNKRLELIEKQNEEEVEELTIQINEIKKHTCLKNFDGPSKSMETDAIVQLVLHAPEKMKAYVRTICMDDDTITRSHIKPDLGPKTKGCLPLELSGITVVADPSHRKRTVSKKYWVLAKKPVAESGLKDVEAKKLTRHFGYFQQQCKEISLSEAEAAKEGVMLHLAGFHEKCGSWCVSKKALDAGKVSNKPPMFNIDIEKDRKTWEQVREVFELVTTKEKLIEMQHDFTTQPNESLNMRAAQVAPKYLNYSRTESLTFRIAFVICIHNLGIFLFFSQVFEELGIVLDSTLKNWLVVKEKRKAKKDSRREPGWKTEKGFQLPGKIGGGVVPGSNQTYQDGDVRVRHRDRRRGRHNQCWSKEEATYGGEEGMHLSWFQGAFQQKFSVVLFQRKEESANDRLC